MIGGLLGGLANLGAVNAGMNTGLDQGSLALLRMIAAQQAQAQQQAIPLALQYLRQQPDQTQQPPTPDYSPQGVQSTPPTPPTGAWQGQGFAPPQASAPGIGQPSTQPLAGSQPPLKSDPVPFEGTAAWQPPKPPISPPGWPAGAQNVPMSGGGTPAGGRAPTPPLTAQDHQAAGQFVNPLLANFPAQFYGRASLPGMARFIEQHAPPGTPDRVKWAALDMMSHMLAPQDKEMMQLLLAQLRYDQGERRLAQGERRIDVMESGQEARAREAARREDIAERRLHDIEAGVGQPGQIIQQQPDPNVPGDTSHTYLLPRGSATPQEIQFPGKGAVSKLGASGAAGGDKLNISKTVQILDSKGNVISTVLAREGRNKAGWVDSQTGRPIELKPGETLKEITPSTAGGGRAGAQLVRQEIGGREVLSDLQNAMQLPLGTTIGPLGTYEAGTSIMGALRGDLVRKLTSQDAQLMQASMANMSRELSILMSPVYGGHWAAQQIDPLIPKDGDTLGTVIFKMARLAQTANNALEVVAKSPALSNDQQKLAEDMRRAISEAVPWTTAQALAFARQGKQDQTFKDFMGGGKTGKGGAATYSTPDDVVNAVASGALSPEEGKRIIVEKFGVPGAGLPAQQR
jgi:hypothetical protein